MSAMLLLMMFAGCWGNVCVVVAMRCIHSFVFYLFFFLKRKGKVFKRQIHRHVAKGGHGVAMPSPFPRKKKNSYQHKLPFKNYSIFEMSILMLKVSYLPSNKYIKDKKRSTALSTKAKATASGLKIRSDITRWCRN